MLRARFLMALAVSSHFFGVTSVEAQELPSEPPTEVEAQAASPASTRVREPLDRSYSVGATFAMSRIRSENNRMGELGPGLTVNYTVGRRFGFAARGTVAFPMRGRQSSEVLPGSVNLIEMYDAQRLSFDVSLMFYYRARLSPVLDLVLGAGVHARTLRLVDSSVGGQFDPIEIIQGGFSGFARLERRFGSRFFYAAEVYAGADPLDFVNHSERVKIVAPIALSLSLGIRR